MISKLDWLRGQSECLLSHLGVTGSILGYNHLWKPLGKYVAHVLLYMSDGLLSMRIYVCKFSWAFLRQITLVSVKAEPHNGHVTEGVVY